MTGQFPLASRMKLRPKSGFFVGQVIRLRFQLRPTSRACPKDRRRHNQADSAFLLTGRCSLAGRSRRRRPVTGPTQTEASIEVSRLIKSSSRTGRRGSYETSRSTSFCRGQSFNLIAHIFKGLRIMLQPALFKTIFIGLGTDIDISLAVANQAVDCLSQFAGSGENRHRSAFTPGDAAIKSTQRRLGIAIRPFF